MTPFIGFKCDIIHIYILYCIYILYTHTIGWKPVRSRDFFLVDINKSAGDLTSPTYGHRIFQHGMEPEAVDTKSSCWLMRCVTWDLDWELLVGLTYIIPYIYMQLYMYIYIHIHSYLNWLIDNCQLILVLLNCYSSFWLMPPV